MSDLVREILDRHQKEPRVRGLLEDYFRENASARVYLEVCRDLGWEAFVDHLTIRCMDVDSRAKEFLALGYTYENEKIEYPDEGWWAKIYRKSGLPPMFIDQAYADEKGKKSILPKWVQTFGENVLHHIAVRVPDIEKAISAMEKKGVEFSGEIVGRPKSRLRQIFTVSENRKGHAFSLLEITERNQGYEGFIPEQADSLMKSSVKKKT